MASSSSTVKSTADRRKVGHKAPPSTALKAYLVLYNALSCLAWSTILLLLVAHVFDLSHGGRAVAEPDAAGVKGLEAIGVKVRELLLQLQTLLARVLPGVHEPAVASQASSFLRSTLHRARTSYAVLGPLVKLVQTAAVLEVVHAALGWVRSPVGTTAMQVASRLWSVWAVAEQFAAARTSPAYPLMLLAWSLTETVRYAFYALTLLNLTPRALTWLRYSTFIALYPLGAGAEAWGAWLSLPTLSSLPAPLGPAVVSVQKALGGSPGVGARLAGLLSRAGASSGWSAFDLVRAGLVFLVWPPALYVMYTYMHVQRRKALGSGSSGRPTVVGSGKKRV